MNSDNIKYNRCENLLKELIEDHSSEFTHMLEKLINLMGVMEREQFLGASRYERTESRSDYANGFKDKRFNTRSGPVNVKVP